MEGYQTCRKCNINKPLSEFYNNEVSRSRRCKVCERERKRVERQKRSHHETDKNKRLLKEYGITIKQFNQMLLEQSDKCKICGKEDDSKYKVLHVDHCHETRKVRGLLCNKCNIGLGNFRDNIENLEKAIKYLKLWQQV